MKEMNVTIEITRDDFSDFNVYWFKKQFGKRMMIYLPLALGLFFYLNYSSDSAFSIPSILTGLLVIVLFFFILYFGLLKLVRHNSKKVPSENGIILGQRKITLTEDEIKEESERSHSAVKWEAVHSIVTNAKYIYIFFERNAAIVIPKRSFDTAASMEAFIHFAESRINNKA